MRLNPVMMVLALLTYAWNVLAADGAGPSAKAEHGGDDVLAHPGDVALASDGHGNWYYTSFPGLAALYVYDKDSREKSNCNAGCDSAWPPLLVSTSESHARVGDWTVIIRSDGLRQWAHKGQPVYTRYHDIKGDDENVAREGFRRLQP